MDNFLNSKISNDKYIETIEGLDNKEKATQKADILIRKPWNYTRTTTLIVLIYVLVNVIAFASLIPLIVFSTFFAHPGHPAYVILQFASFFAVGAFLAIESITTILLLFIVVAGFLIHMPQCYVNDSENSLSGVFPSNVKDVYINGKSLEVVKYSDGNISVYRKGTTGSSVHLILAFKALVYQFKACHIFKKQKAEILNNNDVCDYFVNYNIKNVVDAKRSKHHLTMIKLNRIFSIANLAIAASLTTLVVMSFLVLLIVLLIL